MTSPSMKQRVYRQFARLASALGSDRRLEIIDHLAQGPRHVDALAAATGMPVANVSQHLQVLKQARLVDSERSGTRVVYRLAGDDVLRLWLDLQEVGRRRLAEVEQITRESTVAGADGAPVPRDDLQETLDTGGIVVDVRPPEEYAHGHLPGAISIPLDDLPMRLAELPRHRPIITYCRGTYCQSADEAIAFLRQQGYQAIRLEGGWPEWVGEGRAAEPG